MCGHSRENSVQDRRGVRVSLNVTHISFHAAKNRRDAYTASVVDGATLARGLTLQSSRASMMLRKGKIRHKKNLDPRALSVNKTVNDKTGKRGSDGHKSPTERETECGK